MNQDLEHLRLLSLFHYMCAGLAALFACIPIIHLIMGLMMSVKALFEAGPKTPPIT